MRKFTSFFLFWIAVIPLWAQTSGGPDTYGYTWINSASTLSNKPTYNWIDITNIGTLVSGLDDDNYVGPFNIGFTFHYYWSDYFRFYIGSNGYITFDKGANISSIAIGFPGMPTPDGKDNVVAPFLTDLSLASPNPNSPNPGAVYYWSNNVDTMIVSYVNVPFWQNNTNQWAGANTFQIILCGQDSSITFQYQTQSGTWDAAYNGRLNPAVIGIENVTGSIGLQVSNNLRPVPNRAVKFYYPDSVTYQARDVAPTWVANEQSAGFFIPANGVPYRGNTLISNVGNVALTNTTSTQLEVRDYFGTLVHTDTFTLTNLPLNGSIPVTFNNGFTPSSGATYTYRVKTVNTSDINPTNDVLDVELVSVDTTQRTYSMSYWGGATTGFGATSWTGGNGDDGVGSYYEPPTYPVEITSIDMRVNGGGTGTGTGFEVHIYDDDAAPGTGTLLYRDSVSFNNIVSNNWTTIQLSTPIRIDSGGFYVGWFMSGAGVSIATDLTPPFSFRNYEILNGTWAPFRFNDNSDPMFRVNINKICSVTNAVDLGADTTICDADTLYLDAGANRASITWSTGASSQILPVTGAGTYYVYVEDASFCSGTDTIVVNTLPSPTVDLGPDQSACAGDTIILDPGPGYSSYLWINNATTQALNVTTSGVYAVTVTDANGCTATDEALVAINALPIVDLGQDIDGCAGDAVNLDAGLGFVSYLWSTGATTRNLSVSSSGAYWVEVVDANGCSNRDTVNVNLGGGGVDLGPDTTVCEGGTLVLDAGAGFGAYIWNNGATSQSITINAPGTYSVTVIDGVCRGEDTVVVGQDPLPVTAFSTFSTSNPQRFIFNNTTQFGTTYLWDFGDNTTSTTLSPIHIFPFPGNYVVCLTATNDCGSVTSCDTIATGNVGLDTELFLEEIQVFPNPTHRSLNISFQDLQLSGVSLNLYDLNGKQVGQQQIGEIQQTYRHEWDLGEIAEGLYLLQIISDRYLISRKIQVSRK